ncbi:unnamed protein product [Hermetia illucens]|uniref:Uncharacterized protein n=1 Tax=Hermetia illucens TaxID=343691 RepID=A0A7R8YQB2_HERIL|nr:uncharacterized protein LOC119658251 [Hermetia illucens]CAD7078224.1 unnamed protein product [Hermetia illucens]
MRLFKKCCFCCQLETGAYTIGISGLVGCAINIALTIFFLAYHTKNHPESTSAVIIQVGFAVVGAFCFTSLIVGTKKRNRWLLLPYIILSIIGLIANTVLVIRILASASDYKFQLVFGISYMLGFCLAVYIILCMISLFLKIKHEQIEDKANTFYKLEENRHI